MAKKVTVQIVNEAAADYHTGQTVDVDPVEAKRLVRNGVAVPAKVADAKAVGAPADTAATKK